MPNPRTPSTSDYSDLDRKDRNDNTTLANTTEKPERSTSGIEYPDPASGNEFEVEKRNEVYPEQTPNTEVENDDTQKESE
jgi:hypothetical protein